MPRHPPTFRQKDMTRAVKAVVAAGVNIKRIEVDKSGKIAVITGDDQDDPRRPNDWDDVR